MKGYAVVFEGRRQVDLRSFDVPGPGPGQVLLEAEYTQISPGTELRGLDGNEGNAPPFPFVPGYLFVGVVKAAGEGVSPDCLGKRFAAPWALSLAPGVGNGWGGHSSHIVQDLSVLIPVPDSADARCAPMALLLATALHGVMRAAPRITDTVVVVGLGLLGQLCARLLMKTGARVLATDLHLMRRQLAAGAGVTVLDPAPGLGEAVARVAPEGADVVFDVTGAPAALMPAAELLRKSSETDARRSRLVVQGSYGAPLALDYTPLFNREVDIVIPRANTHADRVQAMRIVSDGIMRVDDLITETLLFEQAAEAYRQLREAPGDCLGILLKWSGAAVSASTP